MNPGQDQESSGQEPSDREVLAKKIEKLLTVLKARNGEPANFPEIRDAMAKRGINLTRTRWHRLRSGSASNKWDPELLVALADYFDVDERYLLEREGQLSEQVEAELNLLNALKLNNAKDVSARTVGDLTPDALNELAAVIERLRNKP